MKKLLLILLLISTPALAEPTIEENIISLQTQMEVLNGYISGNDTGIYRNESSINSLEGGLKLTETINQFQRLDIGNNKVLIDALLTAITKQVDDLAQLKHDMVQLQAQIQKILINQ